VELGLTLPSFVAGTDRATTLEWCRRIDDGPFSSVAVGERTAFHSHEMFSTLAFAAAATERVRIVATVAVVPTHDTVRIAKQAATIDVLSGGRFTLGVGVGGREQDYDALSTPFRNRFARLDEQVDEMRRIWRGEAVIDGVPPIGPTPVQPGGPRILTASMGPKSLARSAKWADGIAGFSLGPDPAEVRATFDAVEAAWRDAGRTTAPALTTSSWYSLADDGAERLHRYASEYLSTFGPDAARAMADLCHLSDAGALREAIAGLAEAGCEEFVLVPTSADLDEFDRLLAAVA
jgi:alkanesulfonate monooxygenase SsuD/methylene tetrahydromethanopterin reductase-like flavin-dependent oxidoreductase (luciferase family)